MKAIVCGMLLAMAAACTPTMAQAPAREPVTITLARTPCFGFCPDYTVTITSDGAVTYHGQRFVRVTGEQHATASREDVAHLIDMIHRADFFNLRDAYRAQVTDLPSTTITVVEGARTKTVVDYAGEHVGMPHAVTEIEQEIDRVAGTERWVPGGGRPKLD
ncbi:MAG TPA: DUF6438 domain-containing protein [Caulobacterales bacterium]|nr:DUF6438 domain-containing protein [Caulobacterales bacterium]